LINFIEEQFQSLKSYPFVLNNDNNNLKNKQKKEQKEKEKNKKLN